MLLSLTTFTLKRVRQALKLEMRSTKLGLFLELPTSCNFPPRMNLRSNCWWTAQTYQPNSGEQNVNKRNLDPVGFFFTRPNINKQLRYAKEEKKKVSKLIFFSFLILIASHFIVVAIFDLKFYVICHASKYWLKETDSIRHFCDIAAVCIACSQRMSLQGVWVNHDGLCSRGAIISIHLHNNNKLSVNEVNVNRKLMSKCMFVLKTAACLRAE